jgi:hypothetical protein
VVIGRDVQCRTVGPAGGLELADSKEHIAQVVVPGGIVGFEGAGQFQLLYRFGMTSGLVQPDAIEVQRHRFNGVFLQHGLIDGPSFVQAAGHVGVDGRIQARRVRQGGRTVLRLRHGLLSS